MSKGRSPDTGRLQEIVRRIVEVAEPQKIIMFGSAARGDMGPNSDVDLLVVKAGSYHRGRLAEEVPKKTLLEPGKVGIGLQLT